MANSQTTGAGTIVWSKSLEYYGGGSDKVYKAQITQLANSNFHLQYLYGRRGSNLNVVDGGEHNLSMSIQAAEKQLKTKIAKGYTVYHSEDRTSGHNTASPSAPAKPAIKVPEPPKATIESRYMAQLLNPIDEEHAHRLIGDDEWVSQEKMDGQRMTLVTDDQCNARFFNRKGEEVPVPGFMGLMLSDSVLDGEWINGVLWVFDALKMAGEDMCNMSFENRYDVLRRVLPAMKSVRLVVMASSREDKLKMFNQIKASHGEGVAFKRAQSVRTPGRPASGGDQLKCKFWESATCIVTKVHATKRSVSLGLIDGSPMSWMSEDDQLINVGNVTVPVNQAIPKPDDLVEVRYLYRHQGGSLFQPTLLGVRTDIERDACTLDQVQRIKAASEDEAAEEEALAA